MRTTKHNWILKCNALESDMHPLISIPRFISQPQHVLPCVAVSEETRGLRRYLHISSSCSHIPLSRSVKSIYVLCSKKILVPPVCSFTFEKFMLNRWTPGFAGPFHLSYLRNARKEIRWIQRYFISLNNFIF